MNKPQLGVTPKNIFEEIRVLDLCRALHEYSQQPSTITNYKYMITWAEELVDRLSNLKYEKEIEE